jgi:hypothetical protein
MPLTRPGVSARPAPPTDASVGTPAALWPLVAFNVVFDLFLAPWGPPGRWFRGTAGRNLLGVVGFLCLAGATVLAAADWLGWTR